MSKKSKKASVGIYAIRCKINDKRYVGSSVNLGSRKNSHFGSLRRNDHVNAYLQYAFNKYGEDNFEFYVLESHLTEDEIIKRESHWIAELDTLNPLKGYNIYDPERIGQHFAKEFIVRKPYSDQDILIKNLNEFCRDNGLISENMRAIARGLSDDSGGKKGEAGWHCRYPNITYEEWLEIRNNNRKRKWTWWILTDKYGTQYETSNLKQFCRDHKIFDTTMQKIARGERKTPFKGWTCRKKEDTPEELEAKFQSFKLTRKPLGSWTKKGYILTKDGKEQFVDNLNQFCKEQKLCGRPMYCVAQGLSDSAHGYHVRLASMSMEEWNELRASKKTGPGKEHRAKEYVCISPKGEVHKVKNLLQFCEKMGLNNSGMSAVANKKHTHHHGWQCFFKADYPPS